MVSGTTGLDLKPRAVGQAWSLCFWELAWCWEWFKSLSPQGHYWLCVGWPGACFHGGRLGAGVCTEVGSSVQSYSSTG